MPHTPVMIRSGVRLPTNIASTCCSPSGIASFSGGFPSRSYGVATFFSFVSIFFPLFLFLPSQIKKETASIFAFEVICYFLYMCSLCTKFSLDAFIYYNNFFVSVNFFLQVFSLYLILYIYLSVLNNTHGQSVSPRNICFPAGHVSVLSAGS